MALVGGDLPKSDGGGGFPAVDAAECQFECDRRAHCTFWSHVDEWKVRTPGLKVGANYYATEMAAKSCTALGAAEKAPPVAWRCM